MPSVSYAGVEKDRDLLNILARQQGKSVGQLVRDAVREKHGKQLDELEAIYFANSHASKHETDGNAKRKKSA